MKYLPILLLPLLFFGNCRFFNQKNDYSHLPADTAQYLVWCDELKEDSNRADILYKRSEYLYKKKQFVKALADANRATALDSMKTTYFTLLGDICFAVNKTKIAASAYDRAIALDKENYPAYFKLGELYYIVKEHDLSLKNYDEAIRLQPSCDVCYFYKGLNFREMSKPDNRLDLAINMFQKAISINPEYYDAYIQLGEIFDKRKPAIALAYYNGALRIQPNSIEALYHRAFHYQERHSYDSAGADYKRITEINPNFVNAYFNVAYINMEQGKWKEAIEGFKLVAKLDPHNAGAWFNLGKCYEKTGEAEKSKQAYTECLRIDPEYPVDKK
jgi:tetratricopeptide (TPR) repeat protein